MFLYGGEYIPFAVIIGIMVILLAFVIYNIVKIGHNDVYSYMNKLRKIMRIYQKNLVRTEHIWRSVTDSYRILRKI